jgi:hypothetical protein
MEKTNEFPSDDWTLPLPDHLQAIVDNAPKGSRAELDEYAERSIHATWSDPVAQDNALCIYYERDRSLSMTGLPSDVYRDTGYLAAELRVLRDKLK